MAKLTDTSAALFALRRAVGPSAAAAAPARVRKDFFSLVQRAGAPAKPWGR
jgi:hypothetical protein